jgi:hypothetical protein
MVTGAVQDDISGGDREVQLQLAGVFIPVVWAVAKPAYSSEELCETLRISLLQETGAIRLN